MADVAVDSPSAVDHGERRVGVSCVAAPLRDRSGTVVAAISVSGPEDDAKRLGVDRVGREVVAAAERISGRLGHIGSWWP